ncbi:polyprenyl synthetase family protein [Candidatus Poribacteria bacterium]|nr:polyprenyl synthetase family protein [Candidatus Poribacteria bacterium]MXY27213.1 polyprenyl synthetase family protein [Candidatus Poribacteria bacterium]MYK17684.1 polyprenyl synthetase family protein [Candidatus Poribacteria bacterium]
MSNFDQIVQLIADDLAAVETRLTEESASEYSFVDMAVQHVVGGGGKRLRPILVVLSAKVCGYEGSDAHTLAAVVELIHVASLVHDDVLDEAAIRRGRETLHARWGNKVAVLVGDYLHARVLSMLVSRRADDPAMAILADTTQAMCEGEVIHAYKSGDFDISETEYLKIISFKTGKLITASCTLGAHLGTTDSKQIEALTVYGQQIGIAFQIVDDVLDFAENPDKLGKNTFGDLREGKLTFPIIYARSVCNDDEKQMLEKVLNPNTDETEAIVFVESLFQRYGVEAYCLKIAQDYADRAKAALAAFPETPARLALQQLANYVVSRES